MIDGGSSRTGVYRKCLVVMTESPFVIWMEVMRWIRDGSVRDLGDDAQEQAAKRTAARAN